VFQQGEKEAFSGSLGGLLAQNDHAVAAGWSMIMIVASNRTACDGDRLAMATGWRWRPAGDGGKKASSSAL